MKKHLMLMAIILFLSGCFKEDVGAEIASCYLNYVADKMPEKQATAKVVLCMRAKGYTFQNDEYNYYDAGTFTNEYPGKDLVKDLPEIRRTKENDMNPCYFNGDPIAFKDTCYAKWRFSPNK